MSQTTRTPAREKYREAEFFYRKLDRADDGYIRNNHGHRDKDEFRFYWSAFASAVAEIHHHIEETEDEPPAFEDWADDTGGDLHGFFTDRCRDIVTVERSWHETSSTADGGGGTTGLAVGTAGRNYCVSRADVPESLDAEGTVPVTDLARTYLDQLDEWLTDHESEE